MMDSQTLSLIILMEMELLQACNSVMTFISSGRTKCLWPELVRSVSDPVVFLQLTLLSIKRQEKTYDFLSLSTGDDFWFQDPNGDPMGVFWLQGLHMVHCAYNSMWMGQMVQPDWDMFQSDHVCAKFHAGSRAICGGPIYLSDSVGSHNFDLIKKLVYPDGTVPKCIHFPLPTRDCLFKTPLFDQQTVLKIWNFNKVYLHL